MRAGKLRHRLALQQLAAVKNTLGEIVNSWSTYATVWGEITPLGGRELFNSDKLIVESTHRCRIRGRVALNEKNRIVYGTRMFGIQNVSDTEEMGREITAMVKEIGP